MSPMPPNSPVNWSPLPVNWSPNEQDHMADLSSPIWSSDHSNIMTDTILWHCGQGYGGHGHGGHGHSEHGHGGHGGYGHGGHGRGRLGQG